MRAPEFGDLAADQIPERLTTRVAGRMNPLLPYLSSRHINLEPGRPKNVPARLKQEVRFCCTVLAVWLSILHALG
jgi:hypothetical protein